MDQGADAVKSEKCLGFNVLAQKTQLSIAFPTQIGEN